MTPEWIVNTADGYTYPRKRAVSTGSLVAICFPLGTYDPACESDMVAHAVDIIDDPLVGLADDNVSNCNQQRKCSTASFAVTAATNSSTLAARDLCEDYSRETDR